MALAAFENTLPLSMAEPASSLSLSNTEAASALIYADFMLLLLLFYCCHPPVPVDPTPASSAITVRRTSRRKAERGTLPPTQNASRTAGGGERRQ